MDEWRECMGIEPTRSLFPNPSPVLKTGAGTSRTHTPQGERQSRAAHFLCALWQLMQDMERFLNASLVPPKSFFSAASSRALLSVA